MKKLMIAACAVALATVAQANTVQWGIASGEYLDKTDYAAGTAYLIDIASLAKASFANEAEANEWFKSNGETLASKSFRTGTVEDGAFISEPELIQDLSGRKNYWMVVVNDDSSEFAISSVTKGITWSAATTAGSLTWSSSQMTSYSVVPEPTTGLLMLLGMAGLALRRRRA